MLSISASSWLSATLHSRRKLLPWRKLLTTACMLAVPLTARAQVLSYAGAQTALTVVGLTAPADVAIDVSGNRYIVNHQASNVIEVSATGVQTPIAVALTNPYAIAVDSAANLYIADYGATHIVKVPAGGGAAVSVGSGLLHPTGVALDSSGNVYVADSGNARVVKVAASNGAQTVVASGSFTTPVSIAIDSSNNIFVSDIGSQKVFEISITGSTITVNTVMAGLTDHPYDIAVDGSDDILLSGGISHTLTLYQVPGQLGANGAVRQLGTGLVDPVGVTVNAAGSVYVADQTAPAIAIIAPGSIDLGQANLCPAGGTQTAPCSQSVTLNFNVASGAALTSVSARVVTQGGENLDFTSTANTCTGTLTGPTTCSITAAFNPLAPGVRLGGVDVSGIVGSASSATLLSSVALQGLGIGPLAGFDAGVITSLPITLGSSPYLSSVIADSSGNLYFVDDGSSSCVVEKFTVSTGVTSVVAGSGTCGTPAGVGGPATSAVLKDPWRLALDGRGDLYISDDAANVIWKVDALTQIITAAAGTPGTPGYSPDGTVATAASLDTPYALAISGAGDLYFTDYHDEIVRKIAADSGVLSTVAGNYNDGMGYSGDGGPATLAELNNPIGLALDSSANIYIVDLNNDVIREVTASTGVITTVAGVAGTSGYTGDGGAATSAELSHPEGIATDAAGNLYIADTNNYVIRKVNASTGLISTIAGTYNGGSASGSIQDSGDGGAANLAGLSDVADVTVDSSGNLYLADTSNNAIREVTPASGVVNFGAFNIGTASAAIDVVVTNNGNAALDLSALTSAANFNTSGTDTSCTANITLNASASCVLGVEFLPTAAGGLTGTLTLTDNAGNDASATQSLALSGTGTYVPTQVILAGVPATITAGGNLGSVQATIESSGGSVVTNSTASVTATITGPGSYSQAVTAAAASGIATLNLSSLPLTTAGTYTVTASSSGLTSSSATVTVLPAPARIAVTGLPSTIVAGGNLGTAIATIEAANGSVITGSSAAVTMTVTGTGYSHAVTASAVNGVATLDLSGFALTAAGAYTVTTTSPGLPTVTSGVTVAAIDFTLGLSSTSSSTQTVAAGAAATYTLSLAPTTATYAQAITFTATGLPAGATATFSPASVTPGSAAVTTTLTIQTSASTTASVRRIEGIGNGLGGVALGLLLLPLAASRRLRQAARRMPMMALLLGLLSFGAVCGLTGCGSSNSSTSGPQAQTYTVTVTGTSGSLSHSTTVTLIVQ